MKRVAFLFTGQSRCNPLSHNLRKDELIVESYSKFIFTKRFKREYAYDIFISTDDIHLFNTSSYFGKNIVNIHLFDTGYYYKNIKNKIKDVDHYIQNYDKHTKKYKNDCLSYGRSVLQQYKIYDAFNMLENYTSFDTYDYIAKIRLDIEFTENIINALRMFRDPKVEIVMQWDLFAIGKPQIMKCYCTTLNNKFGTYNFNADMRDIYGYNKDEQRVINLSNMIKPSICVDYNTNVKINQFKRWTYAPEIQLFETLFEYCNLNNLNINKTIRNFVCCRIKR